MSQGISSTPAITVPYRGIDEWVRIADPLRRDGAAGARRPAGLLAAARRRRDGYPIAAAVALGTLYAVPIIEHGPDSPLLRRRCCSASCSPASSGSSACAPTRSAVAAACVVATATLGAIIAPRMDGHCGRGSS